MTSAVHDHDTTTSTVDGAPVAPPRPGTGGVHEWLPYAVATVAALLVVLAFLAIGNQHAGSTASKPGSAGGATGQLTTGLQTTSFSAACTVAAGPGYQTVNGSVTSNAIATANVTVSFDLFDASGAHFTSGTKTVAGVTKASPAPWQAAERSTPVAASCKAKVIAVVAG
ncbi:MAG: hypothetical protein WCI22_03650 [Actinomycetota bacterium]